MWELFGDKCQCFFQDPAEGVDQGWCPAGLEGFCEFVDPAVNHRHHRASKSRREPTSQQALQISHTILQGGELTGESFGLGIHRPIKPPTLRCSGSERISHHIGRYSAFTHLLLELADTLAGLAADLFERVETGVNHLVQILTGQLARAAHLGERERQRLELLGITLADIAELLEPDLGLLGTHPETHQSLGALSQILHTKRCASGLQLEVVDEFLGLRLITQHGGKRCGVLLHPGVVLNPVFHCRPEAFSDTCDGVPDSLNPTNDCLGCNVGFQHVTEDAGLARRVIHLGTQIINSTLKMASVLGGIFRVITCAVSLISELR